MPRRRARARSSVALVALVALVASRGGIRGANARAVANRRAGDDGTRALARAVRDGGSARDALATLVRSALAALGGGDADDARSCVDEVAEEGEKCAKALRDAAAAFSRGDASAEDAAKEFVTVGEACATKMMEIGQSCAEMTKACERELTRIEKECEEKAARLKTRCEKNELAPFECAASFAELGQACATETAAEVSKCVGEIQVVGSGETFGDDPDDCDAEARRLERQCHDEYDAIKAAIADGTLSFLDGMRKLAALGKRCAKEAMDLRKRCHPDGPPP
jgi:hypothetical protein